MPNVEVAILGGGKLDLLGVDVSGITKLGGNVLMSTKQGILAQIK